MPSISANGGFLKKLEKGFSNAGIAPDHSIICAVSGGPDSTALMLGVHRLRHLYTAMTVAHFNHRARGVESDGDEEFVRRLCVENGIPLRVRRAIQSSKGIDENSARRERYSFLAETAVAIGADSIVVAHTVEDQAETVLLRVVRGAGVRGAGGMRPSRTMKTPSGHTINVTRPMLNISRAAVVNFLDSVTVTARRDSSNEDWAAYARNRIRHRVMPELQALNPNATSAIVRFAGILSSNVNLVEELADEAMHSASTEKPNTFVRRRVASSHPVVQAEILGRVYRSVAEQDTQIDQDHILKLLALISGGKSSSYDLPGGVVFRSDHEHLTLYKRGDDPPDLTPYPSPLSRIKRLPIPGNVDIGDGYRIASTMSSTSTEFKNESSWEALLAPELAEDGYLEIRNRGSTDRFNPLGMVQDVDLNDFLINSKIAASWRDRIPAVVSPTNGRIAWLPGIRPSEWAKLQPTHKAGLHLRLYADVSDVETDGPNEP